MASSRSERSPRSSSWHSDPHQSTAQCGSQRSSPELPQSVTESNHTQTTRWRHNREHRWTDRRSRREGGKPGQQEGPAQRTQHVHLPVPEHLLEAAVTRTFLIKNQLKIKQVTHSAKINQLRSQQHNKSSEPPPPPGNPALPEPCTGRRGGPAQALPASGETTGSSDVGTALTRQHK